MRILDISIKPFFENNGFGAQLITWRLFRAGDFNRTVGLHLQTTNPVAGLHGRQAFAPESASSAPGFPMTWR